MAASDTTRPSTDACAHDWAWKPQTETLRCRRCGVEALNDDHDGDKSGSFTLRCEWCHTDDDCDCAERIACAQAGTFGHLSCGWCKVHDAPAFRCLCGVERYNEAICKVTPCQK